jgi:tetratricopeptide (TPR) repeat protein
VGHYGANGSTFGYIYNWPSKYDLVFWPLTTPNWICFNPKNGYAAFNHDFETLSGEEKMRLTRWLAENYNPSAAPESYTEKLAWLEQLYRQRKKDEDFWCKFYRLMAYVHREDLEKSMEYVKKTIPLLEAKLNSNPEGTERIEVLFLLGEYYRRSGELEKSKQFFEQVKISKYKDKEGQERFGHPYFLSLIQDRENPKKDELSKNIEKNKNPPIKKIPQSPGKNSIKIYEDKDGVIHIEN